MFDSQESMLCTGYSPSLQFTVTEFDTRIYRLLELGASLDGAIQYKIHGKVSPRVESRAPAWLRLYVCVEHSRLFVCLIKDIKLSRLHRSAALTAT